jgi:hypothetical protein
MSCEHPGSAVDGRQGWPRSPAAIRALYCSFCGKSQHEVRKLIAGPTVFICDECVELCDEIFGFVDDAPCASVLRWYSTLARSITTPRQTNICDSAAAGIFARERLQFPVGARWRNAIGEGTPAPRPSDAGDIQPSGVDGPYPRRRRCREDG